MVKDRFCWLGYEVQLYTDARPDSDLVHYVVTREGERQIVAYGQEYGPEAAAVSAHATVQALIRRDDRGSARSPGFRI